MDGVWGMVFSKFSELVKFLCWNIDQFLAAVNPAEYQGAESGEKIAGKAFQIHSKIECFLQCLEC